VATGSALLGVNQYVYCSNNFVNQRDSSGFKGESIFDSIASIYKTVKKVLAPYTFAVNMAFGGAAIAGGSMLYGLATNQLTWDQIGEDIKNFDVYNADADAALDCNVLQMYNGSIVIKYFSGDNSGMSIGGSIYLGSDNRSNSKGRSTLNHEYGHVVQSDLLGSLNYFKKIAIPSYVNSKRGLNDRDYYSQPWERSADYFGGVDRGDYKPGSLFESIIYLIIP
jgi:hypothetical protein